MEPEDPKNEPSPEEPASPPRENPKNAVNKYRENLPGSDPSKAFRQTNPGEPLTGDSDDDAEGPEDNQEPEDHTHNLDYTGRPVVEKVEFPQLSEPEGEAQMLDLSAFKDISLPISAELGKAHMKVRDLISLEQGSVLKLNRVADESIELLLNEIPFARGEVVVINERFGARIVSFLGTKQEEKGDQEI